MMPLAGFELSYTADGTRTHKRNHSRRILSAIRLPISALQRND